MLSQNPLQKKSTAGKVGRDRNGLYGVIYNTASCLMFAAILGLSHHHTRTK
jgi:hypothetical protein